MKSTLVKREKEKAVIQMMISLYCRKNHHEQKGILCYNCAGLLSYAQNRSEHCTHMETKTFCSSCKTNCYSPDMREKIRTVMRWAGPRMLIYHPILVVKHILTTHG
ncbi:MAG: nitrous oxide-stimulated promoter family protein [Clostridiales bacterium]|jgi:hypothetical protein|nr:nitrous oxide-stimulated promoter family protein [Clostridiales bacterium]